MKNRHGVSVVKYGIVLVLAVLLNACASSGTLQTSIPMTVKLTDYKTMLINVSAQTPESAEEVAELEKMTIDKLREKNVFGNVVPGSTSPEAAVELRLSLKIVQLHKVSRSARLMMGGLAGQASIVIEAELLDVKAGKTVGGFKVEAQSSGGTVFAGTTSQAIERAVEQIVGFVQKNV